MDDDVEETCGNHGKKHKCVLFLSEKMKGRDHVAEELCRLWDNIKIELKGIGRRM
jgi:hypothetical protein